MDRDQSEIVARSVFITPVNIIKSIIPYGINGTHESNLIEIDHRIQPLMMDTLAYHLDKTKYQINFVTLIKSYNSTY